MVAFKSGTQAGGFVTRMGVAQGGLVGLSNGRFGAWDTPSFLSRNWFQPEVYTINFWTMPVWFEEAAPLSLDATDAIDILDSFEKTWTKGFTDATGLVDAFAKTQQKDKTDDVQVTDSISLTKAASRAFQHTVDLVSNIALSFRKGLASVLGLSDSFSTTLVQGDQQPMSLVDEKRLVAGAALGIPEPALSALSIQDLMHRYWSMDFPALHVYDGSESPIADNLGSIMDHHARVEDAEDTDLNWIRSIV